MTPEQVAKQITDDRTWQPRWCDDPLDDAALRSLIAQAIRDAYERAAKRAYRGGDPDRITADILRMRDGLPTNDTGDDSDGYDRRLAELMGEG